MEKRKSIITKDTDHCYFCHKKTFTMMCIVSADTIKSYGAEAEEDGLLLPVCWDCDVKIHRDAYREKMQAVRRFAQAAWEERHPGQDFAKRYGKNFIARGWVDR